MPTQGNKSNTAVMPVFDGLRKWRVPRPTWTRNRCFDPIATAVARANARLNRSGHRLSVLTANGFAHPVLRRAQAFDLVLANILPRPLLRLAPQLRRAMPPGGIAILSGLLNHQAREVAMTYRAAGFHLLRFQRLSGWTILVLQRAARGCRTLQSATSTR